MVDRKPATDAKGKVVKGVDFTDPVEIAITDCVKCTKPLTKLERDTGNLCAECSNVV